MSLFPRIKKVRILNVKKVDMRLSFDTLTVIAKKKVGADFDNGDVVVFDSDLGTRRKILCKRNGVMIIVYGKKDKGEFEELLIENDTKGNFFK